MTLEHLFGNDVLAPSVKDPFHPLLSQLVMISGGMSPEDGIKGRGTVHTSAIIFFVASGLARVISLEISSAILLYFSFVTTGESNVLITTALTTNTWLIENLPRILCVMLSIGFGS